MVQSFIYNICIRLSEVVEYFKTIGHGTKIQKWPQPFFIAIMSIVQLSFFTAYKADSGYMDDTFRGLEFNP